MKNLQVITNDIWSCRREAFDCLAAAAFHALKSGDLSGLSALDDDNAVAAQKVNPISGFLGHDGLHGGDSAGESIKILSLRGFLFPWESERIIEEIDDAENDPSVIGVVLDIDGPGGCVSKVDLAATAIRNCSKPTATVVTGDMESAHFWLGVSADRTFVASPLCRVGCVGVVQHFMSFKKYYEEQGIIDTDIYPDSADMKNLEAREMYEKGNDEPLKKLLEKYHAAFADWVAKCTGIGLDMKLPIFRGASFMGDEAVELKYIDAMGGLNDAIKWVFAKATSQKGNSLFK